MSKLNKAVFLDRDGVINKERRDYVKTLEELEIFPDIVKSIKHLKNFGFLIVVITNQSAINRGLTTISQIDQIHATIQSFLKKNGTQIDGFYYCPHRPDENCECRKPKAGLFFKAAYDLKIDLNSSWMIGDNDIDIRAATIAKCRSLKIDHKTNLYDAAKLIINYELK
jgi:D,D-heptose 1,7-bisphosphate phosphatase